MNDGSIILDLSKRHKTFVHGDLTVILTWLLQSHRAVLVIVPTLGILTNDRVTPCIVPDTLAWAWSEDARLRDVKHCVESSLNMAITIFGPGATVQQANRIATLIHDHIDDLISTPPMPHYFDKAVIGTMTIRDNTTGRVIEREMTDDV